MANLSIDTEELISTGNQIVSKSEEFQGLLKKVISLNEQLKVEWQGKDAAAYAQTVSEQAMSMEKLGQAISKIGADLTANGRMYKQIEEENMNAAR